MKRLSVLIVIMLVLCGCSSVNSGIDQMMQLRQKIQHCEKLTFNTQISADYRDKVYTFSMHCQTDQSGELTFTVQSPDSISGITGMITEDKGKLTFDDEVLLFELMADDQLTPVVAPWLMLKVLRSGYISGCSNIESGYAIVFDDSYQGDTLQMEMYTDSNCIPTGCEFYWNGSRILSLTVDNFTIL